MTVPDEDGTRHLHPRIRTLWWVRQTLVDVVLLAVLTVVAAVLDRSGTLDLPGWWPVVPVLVLAGGVAARTWYVGAAYRAWRYRFGPDELELQHGVWWRQISAMPYHRLQQVDVDQGPLERRFGVASVQLRSAAATTDAVIPGISADEVEELRRRLMQRAGRDDGA